MKWFFQLRKFTWLLGFLLLHLFTSDLEAAVIAYDGADYGPTSSINGLNGGIGWQGGWSGGNNIVVGSLVYNGVATNGNHFSTDSNGGSQRVLDPANFPALIANGKLGKKGTTVWLSFLFRPEKTGTNNFAGFNLYDGNNQQLYIGVPTGQSTLALFAPPGNFRSTSITATNSQTFFIVVKMNFGTSVGDQMLLYVNPPVDAEPTNNVFLSAALTGLNFQFDSVVFASGTTTATTASFDEFRLGETFADVAPLDPGRLAYTQLRLFGNTNQMAASPIAGVVEGDDGALYGTSYYGGTAGLGTVYKVNKDGTGYRVIWNFQLDTNGQYPNAIIRGSDGALYGTCGNAGSGVQAPTAFKLNQDGSGFGVLHTFGKLNDGNQPAAGLIEGTDHALYGTTRYGGTNNLGTVYKVNKDGGGYQILHQFQPNEGDYPMAPLLEANDGALYGTTTGNNNGGHGTIFKLNKDGSGYSVIFDSASSTNGVGIFEGGLAQGSDGALYGPSFVGGKGGSGAGTIFRLNTDGSDFMVQYELGSNPTDVTLIKGMDGALYGATQSGGLPPNNGIVFKMSNEGSFTLLHSFDEIPLDAEVAHGALFQATDGLLYGTTATGGGYGTRNAGHAPGDGCVYRLSTDGSSYNIVQSFNSAGADGGIARPGVIQGKDGALYGATELGGAFGVGSVYRMNLDASAYVLLRSFSNSGAEGIMPMASLLEGSDGALYGTCSAGGSKDGGSVFKLNKDGNGYTLLHDLTDAANPLAPLIEGKDGALYGTSHNGAVLSEAYGTIFKLNKDGSNYMVLKGFPFNATDGRFPDAPLLQGSDLALYGVTSSGGANGVGTIFRLNTDGTGFSYIHVCKRAAGDVSLLESGLIEGSDGKLYGISQNSGFGTVGAVFRLDKDGNNFTVMASVGGSPYAPLLERTDGLLYGVTSRGGIDNAGTLFRLNKDGSSYEVLHIFRRSGLDGQIPFAGLISGADGGLYGTTSGGGYTQGTVFALKAAGTDTTPSPLAARLLPSGSLRVTFQGSSQHSYLLQFTDTLSPPNWQLLGSPVADPSGLFSFDDTNAPNHNVRFYRFVTQ